MSEDQTYWFLIVLLIALWGTLIAFFVWRFHAFVRGERFGVTIDEERLDKPSRWMLDKVGKPADSWFRAHPVVPAVLFGAPGGFLVASLTNVPLGVAGGLALAAGDWAMRRRKRSSKTP